MLLTTLFFIGIWECATATEQCAPFHRMATMPVMPMQLELKENEKQDKQAKEKEKEERKERKEKERKGRGVCQCCIRGAATTVWSRDCC